MTTNAVVPDVKPVAAEPSAAAERIQYNGWDEKGTPIVVKQDPPSKQDSAPAAAQEAKPVAGESGAPKDKQESKEGKGKLNAEERIQQLIAENKRLKAEADQAKQTKTAEPSTAKPEPTKPAEPPKELKAPVKPQLKDFTGPDAYEKYEEAKDKYYEELADFKANQAVAKERAERQQSEQQQRFTKLLNDAKSRYPDFEEKARPAAKSFLTDAEIAPAVKAAVSNSDLALELIYVMSGDAAKFAEFIQLAKTDAIAAIEEVGVYKRLIREEQAKAKSSEKEPDPKEKTPVQTQPRAPKPPAEVGGRNTATEDPDKSAARSGDTKAAFAEWDRKAFGR